MTRAPSPMRATRRDVLAYRFHVHGLDSEPGSHRAVTDVPILDAGVQDTGADGALWALANRGAADLDPSDLLFAWTLRGAPHAYRRADVAAIAVATAPWSDDDAGSRIFDAVKPLRRAGRDVLPALRDVAHQLRDLVPAGDGVVKGTVSGALSARVDADFLRACRPCQATHIYEQPFRLSALQAGLELEPDTSPPVLRRIKGASPSFYPVDVAVDPRFDVVRTALHFFGPARVGEVATYLDTLQREVLQHWPQDVVEVDVVDAEGGSSGAPMLLAADVATLGEGARLTDSAIVRLLGPYDPYVQGRDRELLVPDPIARKSLWPILGRPGAIVANGDVVGVWRPKTAGKKLTVTVTTWGEMSPAERALVRDEAERLANHRGQVLQRVDISAG